MNEFEQGKTETFQPMFSFDFSLRDDQKTVAQLLSILLSPSSPSYIYSLIRLIVQVRVKSRGSQISVGAKSATKILATLIASYFHLRLTRGLPCCGAVWVCR